jgi:hypothetical protein
MTDRDATDRLILDAARLIATATQQATATTVSQRHLDGLAHAVEQLAPGLVDRVRATTPALRSTT